MSSDILLYPAIFIFSSLVIGLIFTVVEFSKMQNAAKKAETEKK